LRNRSDSHVSEPVTIRLPRPLAAVSMHGAEPTAEERVARTAQAAAEELAALQQARAALQQAVARLEDLQGEIFRQAEEQLVDLAVEIARKVLAQEIEADRYKIDPIVHEALSNVPGSREIIVHLHPEDLSRCELAGEPGEADAAGKDRRLRFVADPGIPKAQCVLETSQGFVESAPERQLTEISKVLKNPE